MRRFELTYGPKEFAKFDSVEDTINDMYLRLSAMMDQEGFQMVRLLKFVGETPRIRMVAIAAEKLGNK
jgi:hypothetical protein